MTSVFMERCSKGQALACSPRAQYAAAIEKTPDVARQAPQQLAPMPGLQADFETQNKPCGCYPPDTNGDIGATQYAQTVNVTRTCPRCALSSWS
jgi:hypothetical protein